jgi:anti-sigma factor RsiW
MAYDVYFSGRADASLSGADMKNNPMTCEEFVASLQAFRDDELTSPDRIRAQKHLAGCLKCSAYLRGYKRTIELAKSCASGSDYLTALTESLVRKIVAGRRRS